MKSLFIRIKLVLLLVILYAVSVQAQNETEWLRHHIASLSHDSLHGRGYVKGGVEKAARYIGRFFAANGLKSFAEDGSYLQPFYMGINTFPGNIMLQVNKQKLKPGIDYIVHAASIGTHVVGKEIETIDLNYILEKSTWDSLCFRLIKHKGKVIMLKNADSMTAKLQMPYREFAKSLPKGVYLVPKHGKLVWTASTYTVPATICFVEDTVLPKKGIKTVTMEIENVYERQFTSHNVIGYVPGTKRPDSFVVFTAHFDHLGRMGNETIFPGAHDNASGTAAMMYLAQYFAKNPQPYTMVFMGFSGEEAGLLGSEYFVKNPLFPLENIRFLVNLDMTGDASEGITVVNGKEQKEAFQILEEINKQELYLPEIHQREQTNNSDHYSFAQAGVPAVFIYGHGAKGYYHDVFDKVQELSLNNIDQLLFLLIDFAKSIQQ